MIEFNEEFNTAFQNGMSILKIESGNVLFVVLKERVSEQMYNQIQTLTNVISVLISNNLGFKVPMVLLPYGVDIELVSESDLLKVTNSE